ncbi:MAG: 3-isopropylmalate dehydratase [Deltaproteobacteria bacterium]|nr:3-isopropylmalate dehydratase [Deltaproteobacteria bacterium]
MNFFYQSIAAAAGLPHVSAGMKIDLKVDLLLAHDGTGGKLIQAWEKAGRRKVFNGQKVVITLDHQFPAPTAGARALHQQLQDFSAQEGIKLYRHGEGVLHQIVAEQETPWPGMIMAGADGHVSTSGAFGAIAFSLKPEEMVPALATGTLEIVVPEVLRVEIHGCLPPGTDPHDLALFLTGLLGRGRAQGKAVLISGEGIWGLSLDGKMAVCNRIGETGAVTGLIIPKERAGRDETMDIAVAAGEIVPVVACPPDPTHIRPLKEVAGLPVTQVIVGGCTGGRLDDIKALVQAMRGRKVHLDTVLLVTPASAGVAAAMENNGLTRALRQAGAVLNPPGCGPCPGLHQGILAAGDRAVATSVRNVPGRMGAPEAEIYLASPYTAGLAAAAGALVAD